MKKTILIAASFIVFGCAKQSVTPKNPTTEELNAQNVRKFSPATFWTKHEMPLLGSIHITVKQPNDSPIGGRHITKNTEKGECQIIGGAYFSSLITGAYSYTAHSTKIDENYQIVLDSVLTTGSFTVAENECALIEVKF